MGALKTIVYIDGFNFYYGRIKGTPYRWLDLLEFAKAMLPKNEVVRVKYFTAVVKPTAADRVKQVRQFTYLRVLATIPQIDEVIKAAARRCGCCGRARGSSRRLHRLWSL